MAKETIVLGIDPGLATTGWGVLEIKNSKLKMKNYWIIQTPASQLLGKRLLTIHKQMTKLIKKYHPDLVAVEKLFFGKNAKTAMIVGQAKGVILLACQQNNLPIPEYTPLQIKQATCGYGRATKQQVQQMIKRLLKLTVLPKPDDAADALAIAYTASISSHFHP